jgi:hypothetical protein
VVAGSLPPGICYIASVFCIPETRAGAAIIGIWRHQQPGKTGYVNRHIIHDLF